jgi:hypothetical protein
MAGTTTNYGWTYPTSTDLVKDGATAIQTAIQGADTSMFAALSGKPAQGVLLNTTTVSAATTTTFTGIFSTDYDNYRIVWNGVGSVSHSFRITFGAAAAAYYSQLMDFRSSAANPTTQLAISNGAYGILGNNWNGSSVIDCIISNPFKTLYTTFVSTFTTSESTISATGSAGGSLNNTTSYTACTIVPSSGNYTGTFRVYGLRNS